MYSKVENVAVLTTWPAEINVEAITSITDTPAYVVSQRQLTQNLNAFVQFTGSVERVLFPIKTNPSLTVLQLLAKHGAGADCASQQEVDLAQFAGIPLSSISYNSPAQDIKLCRKLLLSGARVVMDDPVAIAELQQIMENVPFPGKLFLRVNPAAAIDYSVKSDNQELMSHAHSSSKFGIPSEDLTDFAAGLKLPVSGLHVHVGTQMDNTVSFQNALKMLNELAFELRIQGHPVDEINMGGGLGIAFSEKDSFPSIEAWSKDLNPLKDSAFCYCAEPGHALVGNAVVLLAKVLSVKTSRGKRWAILDVGTDQLAKVTLLRWPHRILEANGRPLREGIDAVAGPLCFAGDTLRQDVDLSGIYPGDVLCITEAGAYTYSLANRFNGRLGPAWVLLKSDGGLQLMESVEGRYDNLQFPGFRWEGANNQSNNFLDLAVMESLSSNYLKEQASADRFNYISIRQNSIGSYSFEVALYSPVEFLSMPFAIRVFGDASIIAILHNLGFNKKDLPVWGRKLTMDFLGTIATTDSFKFSINLSSLVRDGSSTVIARFFSGCGSTYGSFIVKFNS